MSKNFSTPSPLHTFFSLFPPSVMCLFSSFLSPPTFHMPSSFSLLPPSIHHEGAVRSKVQRSGSQGKIFFKVRRWRRFRQVRSISLVARGFGCLYKRISYYSPLTIKCPCHKAKNFATPSPLHAFFSLFPPFVIPLFSSFSPTSIFHMPPPFSLLPPPIHPKGVVRSKVQRSINLGKISFKVRRWRWFQQARSISWVARLLNLKEVKEVLY